MTDEVGFEKPKGPRCYCGSVMVCRESPYKKGRKKAWFWGCIRYPDCDGAIGCHPGGKVPLGIPVDKETRQLRIKAHEAFDALWQPMGSVSKEYRSAAYRWLAEELDVYDPHIAEMDKEQLEYVIEMCGEMGPEDIEDYLEEF